MIANKSLKFAEQIEFFLQKTNLPTQTWTDVWKDKHDSAFMVAGAYKAELLADLRGAVEKAIRDGTTLETFRKDFDGIVANHGWSYNGSQGWRTRVIYETNLRASYQAGRYAQQTDPAFLKKYPFWRYKHSDTVRNPREQHKAWSGLVIAADDPWWQTHYPPNGWGCRCTVYSESEASAKRKGLKVSAAPATKYVARKVGKTGRIEQVPEGIDVGWDYAPGASRAAQVRGLVQQKAKALGGDLGQSLTAALRQIPAVPPVPVVRDALSREYFNQRNITVLNGRTEPFDVEDAEVSNMLMRLSGAPDNSTLEVMGFDGGPIISVNHPLISSYYFEIDKRYNNIYLSQLFIEDEAPKGFGTRIFALMVRESIKKGIKKISLLAGKSPTMVGYLVWPKFGFDGAIPSKVLEILPERFLGAKTIQELHKMDGGTDWWQKNGDALKMQFDLQQGSSSLAILEAYLVANGVSL